MPDPPTRRRVLDPDLLGVAAFMVVLGVLAGFRALEIDPYSRPAYDLWAYWLSRGGLEYGVAHPGDTGAYLYSPAFAQAIASLTALPWPWFAAVWTVLAALPLLWLAGRWSLPLLLVPPVFLSVLLGQLDLAFAAVAVLAVRWPAVWALPILTKATPGVGLVWYVARREWRNLGIALGVTGAIALASAVLAPGAWAGWLGLLFRMDFPELDHRLIFLPIPLWVRLIAVIVLVAWGARRDRLWVLPVGMLLSLPTVWIQSPAILVALLPLAAAGARTPAAAWLRGAAPTAAPTPDAGAGEPAPRAAPRPHRRPLGWLRLLRLRVRRIA